MDASELLTELRAHLTHKPSHALRAQVYACLNAFETQTTSLEMQRFQAEFLPVVLTSMMSWPDTLRWSCFDNHGTGELMVSRILHIIDPGPGPPDFIESLHTLSSSSLDNFTGLHVRVPNAMSQGLLDALLDIMPRELTYIALNVSVPCRSMLAWVAAHYGQTLTHLGFNHAGTSTIYPSTHHVDPYMEELCNHLDSFPLLKHLSMGHTVANPNESQRWLPQLMAHPLTARLTSLECAANPDTFELSWLTRPGALPHLQCLSVTGLLSRQARELVHAPTLSHVQSWRLSSAKAAQLPFDWLDIHARLWTLRSQNLSSKALLHTYSLDLSMQNHDDVLDIFMDERGSLNTSTIVHEIVFNVLPSSLFYSLFEHGHEAYPHLERVICHSVSTFAVEDYYTLQSSVLWHSLKEFRWEASFLASVYKLQVNYDSALRARRNRARNQAYEYWGMVVMDDDLDVRLRQHAWDVLLDYNDTLTHYRKIARAIDLEIKEVSKRKRHSLYSQLRAIRPTSV